MLTNWRHSHIKRGDRQTDIWYRLRVFLLCISCRENILFFFYFMKLILRYKCPDIQKFEEGDPLLDKSALFIFQFDTSVLFALLLLRGISQSDSRGRSPPPRGRGGGKYNKRKGRNVWNVTRISLVLFLSLCCCVLFYFQCPFTLSLLHL